MKLNKIIQILGILLIIIWLFMICTHKTDISEVPPIARVDNKLYQYSGKALYTPKDPPSGTIKEIVDYLPTKNEQASFGEKNMEYWIFDNELVVSLKGKYLKLRYID